MLKSQRASSSQSPAKIFKCEHINSHLDNDSLLRMERMASVSTKVGFKCPQCGKEFGYERGLKRHFKENHDGGRLKRQHSESPLRTENHPRKGEREHACKLCNKKFASKQKLDNHVAKRVCIQPKTTQVASEEDKGAHDPRIKSLKYRKPFPKIYSPVVVEDFPAEQAGPCRSILGKGNTKLTYDIICAVTDVSSQMYRWERTGSRVLRTAREGCDQVQYVGDQLVFKTVCNLYYKDGGAEIKIYSSSNGWNPPELKAGRWCVMGFFGVKLNISNRTRYLSINKDDGGWVVYTRDGFAIFANGTIKDNTQISKSFESVIADIAEEMDDLNLTYATKGDWQPCQDPFRHPWVSFRIGRVHDIPNAISLLNSEQKVVSDFLKKEIDAVNMPYSNVNRDGTHFHFINGLPGTGKSFLMEALYFYCRSQGVNCKVVAFTKMVANMYKEGATIHSYFGIKFVPGGDEDESDRAKPKRGNLYSIVNLRVLFIDEICCVRRTILDKIDECLKDNHNKHSPFGGLLIIATGDFNQLPPVTNNDFAKGGGLSHGLGSMAVFNEAKFYLLSTPRRVRKTPDPVLIKLMEDSISQSEVTIPRRIILNSVYEGITFAIGDRRKKWKKATEKGCAIICFTNRTVFDINETVLRMHEGRFDENSVLDKSEMDDRYYGRKAALCKEDTEDVNDDEEVKEKGMTGRAKTRRVNQVNHRRMWKGMPLMCIRNTKEGLCNGSRVIFQGAVLGPKGGEKMEVKEIDSKSEGRTYYIGSDANGFPFEYGFALTVHKSQGMTFEKVCVILTDAPFIHGQLTVALTRVRCADDIRVVLPHGTRKCKNFIDDSIRVVAAEVAKKAVNKLH